MKSLIRLSWFSGTLGIVLVRSFFEVYMQRWWSFGARDMATLDLRSLAVFRIAIGMIVIIDAIRRMPSATALYTDDGVLPRSLMGGMRDFQWSILKLWDSPAMALAVFTGIVVAGMLLTMGLWSRVAAVAVWILVTSIQSRNPFTLSGADTLIQVMLFWTMFLPTGTWWSVDAWRRRETSVSRAFSVTSIGALGMAVQVAAMYLFTAILKSGPTWRWDGTALFYATGMMDMYKPFGKWVHRFPAILEPLTHASLVFEFAVPILILLPFARGWGRTTAVFATMAFHVGIWSVMDVGLFPFISSAAMLPLLSSSFWDWIATNLPSLRQFISRTGRDRPMATPANAFLDAFAAMCIALVLAINVASVSPLSLPADVRAIGAMATLDQSWSMFAPNPTRSGQWILIVGTNEEGETMNYIDTLQRGDVVSPIPVTLQPAEYPVRDYFRDKYWRKHYELLERDNTEPEREATARYVCRTWNQANSGSTRLVRVSMILVSVRTLPAKGWSEPVPRHIGSWTC